MGLESELVLASYLGEETEEAEEEETEVVAEKRRQLHLIWFRSWRRSQC